MTINQVEKLFNKLGLSYCRRGNAISYSCFADCMVGIVQRDKDLFFKIENTKFTVIVYQFTSIEYDDKHMYFCINDAKLEVRLP